MNNIKNNDLYKWAEDEENEDANTNDISGANQEGDDLENLLRTNKSILNENKILTNSNNLKYQLIKVYFMLCLVWGLQYLLRLKKNYIKNIQNTEKQILFKLK